MMNIANTFFFLFLLLSLPSSLSHSPSFPPFSLHFHHFFSFSN